MDNDSPERERSDPQITVETAHSTEPGHAARVTRCPHRIRWGDMNPATKYYMAEIVVMAIGAILVAGWCLAEGVIALRGSLPGGDFDLALAGFVATLLALPLALGGIESLRGVRSMHRPHDAVDYLHNAALVVMVVGLIVLASGREWIVLAAIPAMAVANDLRTSRKYLRDRSTCRTDPTLPPEVLAGMSTWTADPPVDREIAAVEGRLCWHFIEWKHLRPWALVEFFVHRALRLAYLGGAAVLYLAVLVDYSAFLADLPGDDFVVMTLLVLVPLALHGYAYNEWRSGPYLHRLPVMYYVWSIAAYALTAALAGRAAMTLDRPYFWALVPLAAASIYLTLWRAALYSDPRSCETQPELHPRVRARLKS
jgi:hypothetical protein